MGLISESFRRTGAATLARPLVAVSTGGERQPPSLNPFALAANLGADVADIILGLGGLGGALLGDLGRLAIEAATLGRAETGGYATAEIARNLFGIGDRPSAFLEDLKARYGGGIGNILRNIYEHPGFFLSDLLAVAGGAGTAARGLAGIGTAGKVARALGLPTDEIARGVEAIRAAEALRAGGIPLGAPDLSRVGPVTRAVERLIPKRYGVLAQDFGPLPPEGATLSDLLSSAHVLSYETAKNPLTRALLQPLQRRLLARPVSELERTAGVLEAKATAGLATPDELAGLRELEVAIDRARALGTPLVETPLGAKVRLSRLVDRIVGRRKAEFIRDRQDLLTGLAEAAREIRDTPMEQAFYRVLEGLDTTSIEHLPADELASRLQAKGFASPEEAVLRAVRDPAARALLDADERATLGAMLRRGDLQITDFHYVVDEELLRIPERAGFERSFRDAAARIGMPQEQVEFGLLIFDQMAKSVFERNPTPFGSLGGVYAKLGVEFAERFVETQDQLLQEILVKPQMSRLMEAARRASPDERFWYERSTKDLIEIFDGYVSEIPEPLTGGTRRISDFELFANILAATSVGQLPIDNMRTAWRVFHAWKTGRIDWANPETIPAAGGKVVDTQRAMIREILHDGHTIDRWDIEVGGSSRDPRVVAQGIKGKTREVRPISRREAAQIYDRLVREGGFTFDLETRSFVEGTPRPRPAHVGQQLENAQGPVLRALEAPEPGYVYHATSDLKLDEVAREGLVGTETAVAVADHPGRMVAAAPYRTSDQVVLRIRANAVTGAGPAPTPGEWLVRHRIPSHAIEYLAEDGSWYPLAPRRYAVSVARGTALKLRSMTRLRELGPAGLQRELNRLLREWKPVFRKQPIMLGGWVQTTRWLPDGTSVELKPNEWVIHLDPSEVVADRGDAVLRGALRSQEAIWGFDDGEVAIVDALGGDVRRVFPDRAPLTADARLKVRSFHANIMGEAERMTVDRRIGAVWGFYTDEVLRKLGLPTAGPGRIGRVLKAKGYHEIEDVILELTDRLNRSLGPGEPKWLPMQVQAALWGQMTYILKTEVRRVRRLAKIEPDPARRQLLEDQARVMEALITEEAGDVRHFGHVGRAFLATDEGKRILREIYPKVEPDRVMKQLIGEVKGSVHFGPDFQALIRFYRSGDFTTLVHEAGHVLRRWMAEDDLRVLERHYLGGKRRWTKAAEEAFAEDVERYFLQGTAPRPELLPIFDRIREALRELWHRIRGWVLENETVPREVAAVLDRYFGPAREALAPKYADLLETGGTPRRVREIPVTSITARYPSAASVAQAPGNAETLLGMARDLELPVRAKLAEVFGYDAVEHRVKPARRIEALRAEGVPIPSLTDLLGYRITLGGWGEVDDAIARIEQAGLEVLGVADTRGVPEATGRRGVVLKVRDPSSPLVFEVELGTRLWRDVREATVAAHHRLDSVERQIPQLEAEVAEARAADAVRKEKLAEQLDFVDVDEIDDTAIGRSPLAIAEAKLAAARAELDKGRRYLQGLWEQVADEIDGQLTGRSFATGPVRRTFDRVRLWVARELEGPLIEMGVFDLAGVFDRQYLPLRLQSGARWDVDAKDFVGGRSSVDLDTERAARGLPAPVYFPHIDPSKAKPTDFLLGVKTVGMRRFAEPGFLRRDTGYLFERGEFITDPMEAYSRRAARALKWRDTYDLVRQIADTFGRRISSTDELMPGERVFAPDGLLRFFNVQIGITDYYLSKIAEALDDDPEILREAIQEVLDPMQREIVAVTKRGLELYAIPEIVARRLEAQVLPKFGVNARLFFDTPTAVWRSFVLAGSPRWVVYNMLGNVLFLKLQGGKLTDVIRQLKIGSWRLDPEFSKLLDELTPRELRVGHFSTEQQYMPQLGVARGTAVGQLYERIGETKLAKGLSKLGGFTVRLNAALEEAFRKASFVRALERQQVASAVRGPAARLWTSRRWLERVVRDGLTPHRMEQALEEAYHFLNDYGRMTPLERQVIRRFLVPFWSFYRHVIRLVATYPFEFAGRFRVLEGLAMVERDMRQELGPTPSWLKTAVPFGEGLWLSTRGMNPFTAVVDSAESGLNLMHPIWKILVERSTGRSAFTGKEFSDPNVVVPFGSAQKYRIDPETGVLRPVDKVVPGPVEHVLQQFPQYQLLKDLVAGGVTYDTATLTDVLLGRGVIRDPVTGEPRYPGSAARRVAGFFGFPVFPFDLETYQARVAEEAPEALSGILERLPPLERARLQLAAVRAALEQLTG